MLQKDINEINKDPYSVWFLGGDYCDWISTNDKRFDAETIDPSITVRELSCFAKTLLRGIIESLDPISFKCLGALYGNHELKYMREKERADLHDVVCDQLQTANMRLSGWTDIYFQYEKGMRGIEIIKEPKEKDIMRPGQRKLRVFIHHGFSCANTVGGKMQALNRLQSLLATADLCVMGHLHDELTKRFVRLAPDQLCKKIIQKETVALLAGSYLRTYEAGMTTYGEQRGYAVTTLGMARAHFIPIIGRLVVETLADNVGEVIA
jgi:hypothetical protein